MKPDTTAFVPERPYSVAIERRELLPFRVRLAENAQDIERAVEIRAAAYARHIPTLGHALRRPEADDLRPDALLLIAESKLDGVVVGSLRLQHNFDRPLRIEGELTLPDAYQGRRLVEVRRLGVGNGISGRMVMAALVKAAYELCHAADVDYPHLRRSPVGRGHVPRDALRRHSGRRHDPTVLRRQRAAQRLRTSRSRRRSKMAYHRLFPLRIRRAYGASRHCVNYERVFAVFGVR